MPTELADNQEAHSKSARRCRLNTGNCGPGGGKKNAGTCNRMQSGGDVKCGNDGRTCGGRIYTAQRQVGSKCTHCDYKKKTEKRRREAGTSRKST